MPSFETGAGPLRKRTRGDVDWSNGWTSAQKKNLDPEGKEPKPINLVIEGTTARTDRETILGADDRASVAMVLYLAHFAKITALYLLFSGEEIGRKGSSAWVKEHDGMLQGVRFAIQVDRRGKTEIITHQEDERCVSDAFAEALARELGMGHKPSDKGRYADTFELRKHVPVNIAAGYENQHEKRGDAGSRLPRALVRTTRARWLREASYREGA